MAADWKTPEDWQKDGSIISGVTNLKTGAWTSMLSAKEQRDGREVDVVIKTFSVPEHVLEDPDRVAREREKFLKSARVQKQLTDGGAAAWVPILRISEDSPKPSFSMVKMGASLQDILDRRVTLTAKDLYEVTMSVLQGFEEIQTKAGRSHGSLKASDVLSVPGHSPPYQMADPSPKGENHAANDLFALGQILFQLVEHKEWDPLTPIIPTSNWSRFKKRRDRWIQFLNMLLAPNGCQESLANVRREAQRLKPSSPLRTLAIAASLLMCFGLMGIGALILAWPTIKEKLGQWQNKQPVASGNGGSGNGSGAPAIDPTLKADWQTSYDAYRAARDQWRNRPTNGYTHTGSATLVRGLSSQVNDTPPTTAAEYTKSKEMYDAATAKYGEALAMYAEETKTGQAEDAAALADLQNAQDAYKKAKADWETAAGQFDAKHDHTRSTAFAQATPEPAAAVPADAAGRRAAGKQLTDAAARYNQAVAMAKDEDTAGKTVDQAKADLAAAQDKYRAAKQRWEAAAAGVSYDIAAAQAAADKARAGVPDTVVPQDLKAYQDATAAFADGAGQYDGAVTLLTQIKADHDKQDAAALAGVQADYQAERGAFDKAKREWEAAAAKFGAEDHSKSKALVQEIRPVPTAAASDLAGLRTATEKLRAGVEKYEQAVAMSKQEASASIALDPIRSEYQAARKAYEATWAKWNAATTGVTIDYAGALAAANAAKAMTPVQANFPDAKGYQDATAAFKTAATKLDTALKLLAQAMLGQGNKYLDGVGVAKDEKEAMKWFLKAADLNLAEAVCNVGWMYDHGVGMPGADHKEAMSWYKRAADMGDYNAMFDLGALYQNGQGTQIDMAQAVAWYRKAANQDVDPVVRAQARDQLRKLGFEP